MEQEKKDDIGQLFRSSFEGHKQDPEPEEWAMLQTSMQSLNFFKFNALQFNVYYAGMIAFCFLTCVGMGAHYTFTHVLKPQHELQSNTPVTKSNGSQVKNSTQKDGNISNPARLKNESNSDSEENSAISNATKTINHNESHKNIKLRIEEKESNTLSGQDIHSDSKLTTLSNIKIDSSHKSNLHKEIVKTDSSKNKKRTIYITKQDTIYKYDTLRAPKPKRRRF